MKRLVLVFILIFFTNTYSKECSCGSFEEGLVDFQVEGDEAGCCEGAATGVDYLTEYEFSESGTWEIVSVKRMLASDAQKKYCYKA